MNPDSPASPYTPAETEWVDAQLVRSLVRVSGNTQVAIWVVIPIYVGVMWDDTQPLALVLWTLAALGVAVVRALVVRHYERHVSAADPDAQLAFYARARHLWTASALVWASSVGLFFERAPLSTQFICWLILASITMLAVNGLSPVLGTMRAYLHTLMGAVLAIVVWRVAAEHQLQGPYYHYWLLALLAIFWQVLYQAGQRQHRTHRRNFELQYRNSQLIESLTRQTRAALDAVEIKNRFLASATHDIRQPVLALGLYADWLAKEPELVGEIAPKIVESTRAVNALFDSLFDLVRLDSGKIRLKLETVSLDKLLDDLELQYRPLAQAKGLQLRVRRAGGMVHSDRLLLARILGNLVSNAIKYTERGTVLLAVRHVGTRPCVEVRDTGLGIAPEHQRDIFREFYKVPVHEGTQDGFGLGLYIVSRLAHILGHPVELKSEPGRGTRFRLVLDASDPQQATARAASIDQLASRP
jgi:signal transduction histidine kinase